MCRGTSARLNTPDKLTTLRLGALKACRGLPYAKASGGTHHRRGSSGLVIPKLLRTLTLPVPSVMYCIVTSYLNNISQFVWKASAVLPRLPVQQTSTEYVEKYRETAQDYLKATKPTENAENNQPGLFPGEASHSLRPSPKLCGDGDENRNVMRSMTRMISISGPCHLLV